MAKVKIGSARLSFPHLFQHGEFNGESTGKYEATFILDKVEHANTIKQLQSAISALQKDIKAKLSADKIALKDGDEMARDEYVGKMVIKASTKKRPLVINRDKSPITEDDNVIYGGCYVNVIISLWAQNNAYGKRINASLEGVQFARDGEPFGAAGVDAQEFDEFDLAADFPDDEAF